MVEGGDNFSEIEDKLIAAQETHVYNEKCRAKNISSQIN